MKYHLFKQKTLDQTSIGSSSEEETEELESEVSELAIEDRSSIQETQVDIVYSCQCQIVSPGAVIPGTLAITNSFMYFSADEEDENLKNIDPKVMYKSGKNLSGVKYN